VVCGEHSETGPTREMIPWSAGTQTQKLSSPTRDPTPTTRPMTALLRLVVLVLVLSTSPAMSSLVQTITVNTTTDGTSVAGFMTLRQALQLANAASTSTTIKFSPNVAGGTIKLTSGAFSPLNCLDCTINIDASGGAPVVIDAQKKSSMFVVYNGVNFGWGPTKPFSCVCLTWAAHLISSPPPPTNKQQAQQPRSPERARARRKRKLCSGWEQQRRRRRRRRRGWPWRSVS